MIRAKAIQFLLFKGPLKNGFNSTITGSGQTSMLLSGLNIVYNENLKGEK
jgi:hypothetical protein